VVTVRDVRRTEQFFDRPARSAVFDGTFDMIYRCNRFRCTRAAIGSRSIGSGLDIPASAFLRMAGITGRNGGAPVPPLLGLPRKGSAMPDSSNPTSPSSLTRRTLLGTATVAATAAFTGALENGDPATAGPTTANTGPTDVGNTEVTGADLHWLAGVPATTTGAAFGVPWARGTVPAGTPFALHGSDGTDVPVQTWPLAYWPDGTLKWTGHALPAGTGSGAGGDIAGGGPAGLVDTLHLAPGTPAAPATPVTVKEARDTITLDTGVVTVVLARHGDMPLVSLSRDGAARATNGKLVLTTQDRPDNEPDSGSGARGGAAEQRSYTGIVEAVAVEQRGPVRAVVRLSGRYHGDGRAWLPWTVRVYASAGAESVRIVHSFRWDGDLTKDFVTGLGLRVDVPITGELHDRHVRFVGTRPASGTDGSDGVVVPAGVWGEAVRGLSGLRRDAGAAVLGAQFDGTATPPVSQWPATVSAGYQQLAVWNDYRLTQVDADAFQIWKRTSAAGSWLRHAGHGTRAAGLGYVGSVGGGLAFGLRDFWQQHPRALDIRGAAGATARVTLWSWAPDAPPMDLRHYDTTAHGLDLAYEDVQQGFSTPEGMARSTEAQLWALPATPSRDRLVALAGMLAEPPQPVAAPATYHAAGVFGRWSLPDRSTPGRAALEDEVDANLAFYLAEVEQRRWYGFWHYGDVMHTYDDTRHCWRYDVGGYAWDNAELGTDLWLWYSFLRTGRADLFRAAGAMTRHVSEVDFHHSGRFAGLGSRHNVSHWGDGAKEVRISQAILKRFYRYLTTDELTGDWMRSALQADNTLRTIDPLREVLPPFDTPARVRIGPDWVSLAGNWLAEWERTNDHRWRDRLATGMRDLGSFTYGLFTGNGGAVGFDPATGHLSDQGGSLTGSANLYFTFGGDQTIFELLALIDEPTFTAAFTDFARLAAGTTAERQARYGQAFNPSVFPYVYSRLMAWAGEQANDATLRRRGWALFTGDASARPWPAEHQVGGTSVVEPVTEIPGANTNTAAQRALSIIELLAIAPDEAP
jgi:hypothetical protein